MVGLIVVLILVVFYLLWMRSKPSTTIAPTTGEAKNPIEVSFNEFLTSLQGLATAIRNNTLRFIMFWINSQSEWYKNWMEKIKSSTETPSKLQRRILDSKELYRQA